MQKVLLQEDHPLVTPPCFIPCFKWLPFEEIFWWDRPGYPGLVMIRWNITMNRGCGCSPYSLRYKEELICVVQECLTVFRPPRWNGSTSWAGWIAVSLIFNKSGCTISGAMKQPPVFDGFTWSFSARSLRWRSLQEELPEDVILSRDVGSPSASCRSFWENIPRQHTKILLYGQTDWVGWASDCRPLWRLKLINPASTVVCWPGDGGFLMMAGEIITARSVANLSR